MRVLIIEDNTFNAFCLSRLLKSVVASVSIDVVANSHDALSALDNYFPEFVIVDGELSLSSQFSFHGPELSDVILQKNPHLPLIAWTDSELMLHDFSKVFMHHNRLVNEYNVWNKTVSLESIRKTWAYYFRELNRGSYQQLSSLAPSKGILDYHANVRQ